MDVTHHARFLANPIALAASAELRANAAANATRIRELETMLHTKRRELARLHSTKRLRSTSISPPVSASSTPLTSSPRTIDYVNATSPREMAARGSHWSFAEKARFEAALHRYGPFAWDHIIRAVATRSEKQVKAYAARYRRRKKLAAKAQQEAVRAFAAAQLNAAAAAAAAAAANHSLALSGRAPTRIEVPKSEPRLATIMPADFRAAPSVHMRSPGVSSPFACNVRPMSPASDAYDHWSPPVGTVESTLAYECTTPDLTTSATTKTDGEDGTDADAFGTDSSVVESSSNSDSLGDILLCDDATEQDEELVHLMRAASDEMSAEDESERRLSFECTLLRDGEDWTLPDRLGDELLRDALLGAAL